MLKKTYKHLISHLYIYISILLSLVIVFGLLDFYVVEGTSMSPFLDNNCIILCDKFFVKFFLPDRNDIITIKLGDDIIVKRVLGIPGDKVCIKSDCLYINDKVKAVSVSADEIEFFLKNNEFFVLGDNYSVSIDGRHFGPIMKNKIVSKLLYKFN